MPATHLLDTSIYSQPLKRNPRLSALKRWDALGDARVVVSSICEAEILFGIEKNAAMKQAAAFETTLRGRLTILPICSNVARAYAQLRADCESKGQTIGDLDLLIAATAHAHGLTVATLNLRHFGMIDGITVEDWSQP